MNVARFDPTKAFTPAEMASVRARSNYSTTLRLAVPKPEPAPQPA